MVHFPSLPSSARTPPATNPTKANTVKMAGTVKRFIENLLVVAGFFGKG
jgi:hypothetical protein